jgi:hypothetical protein
MLMVYKDIKEMFQVISLAFFSHLEDKLLKLGNYSKEQMLN